MDPCPFVRVLVGNLALKMPAPAGSSGPRGAGTAGGAGVHPTTAPCHCRIRLDKLPYQLATAPLLPSSSPDAAADDAGPPACTGAFAAAFHLSRADLDRATAKPALFGPRRVARLKVAVYSAGRGQRWGAVGTPGCASGSGGRLLGKVVIPLDLKAAEGKPVVFHTGWVAISNKGGGHDRRKAKAGQQQQATRLHLTVRAEPDPRFVFQFDGEPECSPQVMQVRGSMRQPMFTCRFSCRSSGSSDLRSRSVRSDPGGTTTSLGRSWLSSTTKLFFDRDNSNNPCHPAGMRWRKTEQPRKGWSVTVHDLSGSPVALASMVTPFVASPGSDRVSRSNPGAWLVLRPGGDGHTRAWNPWGRLECWRERGDALGYRFELLLPDAAGSTSVCVAESSVPASKGGRFVIDLTPAQPFASPPGCGTATPRGSGDWGGAGGHHGLWPFGTFRGFVMSAAVQGEGRCSRPAVEVGVAHVGCAEDAAAFVALAAAVDLSMDACRLFSRKLRRELSGSRADLLR